MSIQKKHYTHREDLLSPPTVPLTLAQKSASADVFIATNAAAEGESSLE